MALNTPAFFDRMVALATAAGGGVQLVRKGEPEQWPARVTLFASVGPQRPVDRAGGLIRREMDIYLTFGYRIKGAESTAEDILATWLDAFVMAWYADRQNIVGGLGFNGTASNGRIDVGAALPPEYPRFAGQEIRTYLIIATGSQDANI